MVGNQLYKFGKRKVYATVKFQFFEKVRVKHVNTQNFHIKLRQYVSCN